MKLKRFAVPLLAGSLLCATLIDARAQGEPPPLDLKAVALTAELFQAISSDSAPAIAAAIDHGADPNRKNWIDIYPLDWAVLLGRTKAVAALLERGAKPDTSSYGTMVPAAAMMGNEPLALRLLDQGVAATSTRPDKATTLMLAAAFASPRLIDRLKPTAADLETGDIDGATALIYAARLGKADTGRRLLAAGAKVDGADKHGRTPLMYAAMNGHLPMVDLLLAHGAKPGLVDAGKASALHLVARYNGSAAVARKLIAAKAPVSRPDATGKSPLALAQGRQFTALAGALKAAGGRSMGSAAPSAVEPAIQRSVVAMQSGMKRFLAQSQCVSCHHQGLGLTALGRARQRGFTVDSLVIESNVKRIVGENLGQMVPLVQLALSDPAMAHIVPTSEMAEMNVAGSFLFQALDAAQVQAGPEVTALVQYQAKQQAADGSWPILVHRGPMQESQHTINALQALGIKRFLPAAQSAPVLAKARGWFRSAPTVTTEDGASRLLGLRWTGADAGDRGRAALALLARQNPDGGWGVRSGAPSDPLTTGMALYSLRVGGDAPVSAPGVKKATAYLLRTQDESGAWYLNKTIQPFNYFFDTGYPGGESQYASFGASAWATLALIEVAPPKKTAAR